MSDSQVEKLMCAVSALDRKSLIRQFQNYRGSFPVDFTPDFLNSASVDRLRHIFVAMCVQNKRLPEFIAA